MSQAATADRDLYAAGTAPPVMKAPGFPACPLFCFPPFLNSPLIQEGGGRELQVQKGKAAATWDQ